VSRTTGAAGLAPGNPVRPVGVDHVAVNVPDVPAAIAFYTEHLGLRLNGTRPDFGFPGAWLDTATGQQVHLIEATVPQNAGQHFALAFEDLPAVVDTLRARGLEVSDWVDVGSTGRRQAFTTDPWGNLIELHQRPAS
jgi:glyoxylase I family protein